MPFITSNSEAKYSIIFFMDRRSPFFVGNINKSSSDSSTFSRASSNVSVMILRNAEMRGILDKLLYNDDDCFDDRDSDSDAVSRCSQNN